MVFVLFYNHKKVILCVRDCVGVFTLVSDVCVKREIYKINTLQV